MATLNPVSGPARYIYARQAAAFLGKDIKFLGVPAVGEWIRGKGHGIKTSFGAVGGMVQLMQMQQEVAPAKHEQGNVPQQDHQTDGEAGKVVDDLRKAADAAVDQVGGHQEEADGQRLQQRAQGDQQEIAEGFPREMRLGRQDRLQKGFRGVHSSNFDPARVLEHAQHRRVIQLAHAHLQHGVEQLGVQRRGGQRDAVLAGSFQDDVQVFGLHVRLEARGAVAGEQARRFDVQRPALRRAALDRFDHLLRVGPGFAGKDEQFAHRHHLRRHHDLVGSLGNLPGAGLAHVRDRLAHRLEDRHAPSPAPRPVRRP